MLVINTEPKISRGNRGLVKIAKVVLMMIGVMTEVCCALFRLVMIAIKTHRRPRELIRQNEQGGDEDDAFHGTRIVTASGN